MISNGTPLDIFLQAINMCVAPAFVIDAENKQQLEDLCDYFTQQEGNLNLQKGICIIGQPGTGKTLLLETFGRLIRNLPTAFKITDCPKASTEFSEHGAAQLHQWNGNWLFDDLGQESKASYFGDKRELMHDVVFEKYNQWRRNGTITHFTSNHGKKYMTDRYGEHFYSRLSQMCNIVLLGEKSTSKDRRFSSTPKQFSTKAFPTFFTTERELEYRKEIEAIQASYERNKNMPQQSTEPTGVGSRLKKELGEFVQRANVSETEISKKHPSVDK